MFNNFLKIAFRNLWKNKGFTLINITGLAIGMASAMLLLLWIYDEVSYDRFHEKRDRIYEAWNRAEFSGELHCWNTTPVILAKTMERDFLEVEHAVRVNWPSNFLFTVRLTIHWWVFALAGLLSVLIALITVSYQSIKAALSNPVRSLRTE